MPDLSVPYAQLTSIEPWLSAWAAHCASALISVDVVAVTHIAHMGDDPPTEARDEVDRLGEVVLRGRRIPDPGYRSAQVEQDEVGTLLRQALRVRPSLPARCSGDQCNLAVHPAHGDIPSSDFAGTR